MSTGLTLITLIAAAVPVVITLIAVRIGSRQAREFHERTGDSNLFLALTALSTFSDTEVKGGTSDEVKPAKVRHHV